MAVGVPRGRGAARDRRRGAPGGALLRDPRLEVILGRRRRRATEMVREVDEVAAVRIDSARRPLGCQQGEEALDLGTEAGCCRGHGKLLSGCMPPALRRGRLHGRASTRRRDLRTSSGTRYGEEVSRMRKRRKTAQLAAFRTWSCTWYEMLVVTHTQAVRRCGLVRDARCRTPGAGACRRRGCRSASSRARRARGAPGSPAGRRRLPSGASRITPSRCGWGSMRRSVEVSSRRPRTERNSASFAPRKVRPRLVDVPAEPVDGLLADRHHPLLRALAEQRGRTSRPSRRLRGRGPPPPRSGGPAE